MHLTWRGFRCAGRPWPGRGSCRRICRGWRLRKAACFFGAPSGPPSRGLGRERARGRALPFARRALRGELQRVAARASMMASHTEREGAARACRSRCGRERARSVVLPRSESRRRARRGDGGGRTSHQAKKQLRCRWLPRVPAHRPTGLAARRPPARGPRACPKPAATSAGVGAAHSPTWPSHADERRAAARRERGRPPRRTARPRRGRRAVTLAARGCSARGRRRSRSSWRVRQGRRAPPAAARAQRRRQAVRFFICARARSPSIASRRRARARRPDCASTPA